MVGARIPYAVPQGVRTTMCIIYAHSPALVVRAPFSASGSRAALEPLEDGRPLQVRWDYGLVEVPDKSGMAAHGLAFYRRFLPRGMS